MARGWWHAVGGTRLVARGWWHAVGSTMCGALRALCLCARHTVVAVCVWHNMCSNVCNGALLTLCVPRFVVMGLLKGSPSLLGPLLYICAAASRCIMDSNADLHVIDQCGNPILPTFCLTVFLFWTWFITVLVPPIWHREMITWSDIARWSLASDTSREGVAYGGMCFTALLLFATLYEDGSSASWLVVGLMCLFFFFTGGLLFLVTVDSYVIPMIYGTKESRNVRTDSSAGVFGHMVGDGSSKNLDSGAGDDKFDLEIGELVL